MKLAVMQPYFLPYLGYFSLIDQVENFILFDTVQFIRHGWIERNLILHPYGKKIYIRVPLKKFSRNTKINQVEIRHEDNWKKKIMAQVLPYRKFAQFYPEVINLLNKIFDQDYRYISEINYQSLKIICEYLGIDTKISIWSAYDITYGHAESPDDWALNISKTLKSDTYYNSEGGMQFFDNHKFQANGINLKFIKFQPTLYPQYSDEFFPNLSIVDALMFNPKERVLEMIKNVEIV